jgi:hypothetical protein
VVRPPRRNRKSSAPFHGATRSPSAPETAVASMQQVSWLPDRPPADLPGSALAVPVVCSAFVPGYSGGGRAGFRGGLSSTPASLEVLTLCPVVRCGRNPQKPSRRAQPRPDAVHSARADCSSIRAFCGEPRPRSRPHCSLRAIAAAPSSAACRARGGGGARKGAAWRGGAGMRGGSQGKWPPGRGARKTRCALRGDGRPLVRTRSTWTH